MKNVDYDILWGRAVYLGLITTRDSLGTQALVDLLKDQGDEMADEVIARITS